MDDYFQKFNIPSDGSNNQKKDLGIGDLCLGIVVFIFYF